MDVKINPKFLTTATKVQRNWREVRMIAKNHPLYVMANDECELVIISFKQYAKLSQSNCDVELT